MDVHGAVTETVSALVSGAPGLKALLVDAETVRAAVKVLLQPEVGDVNEFGSGGEGVPGTRVAADVALAPADASCSVQTTRVLTLV